MKRFNLSDWSLNHRSMIWYFMLIISVAGVLSYIHLGRREDPHFTIKEMIVQAKWPGASTLETMNQVTDRIEKKLSDLPQLDYTESQTRPGQATVFVHIKDTIHGDNVRKAWLRVRNMIGDIKGQFPRGVQGPFFNDDFSDVYGNIYALTGDGISRAQLRDYGERIKLELASVPDIGKVGLIGEPEATTYLEFSTQKMANLGVTQAQILQALAKQNAVSPSGEMDAAGERIAIRVDGAFSTAKSLGDVTLWVNHRSFRLQDVARIKTGYADPPTTEFRYDGQTAIGVAVGMVPGANLLSFGHALSARMRKIEAQLPVGVKIQQVSDQPAVVKDAIGRFTRALFEAVAIVLAVSFVSLGLRAGVIVALSIPLVLAMTFFGMQIFGISMQRISLGALIIALGLLVDDAMIAVEMMVAKLEEGEGLRAAATAVYATTAFPMLTGTLVTVTSYMPVGLNNSNAGEFVFSLFEVIAIALTSSWVVAVLFTPLLGVTFLPKALAHKAKRSDRLMGLFTRTLRTAMTHHRITVALAVPCFVLAVVGMTHVQKQFFPTSDRTEVIVDWHAPQNATIAATRANMTRFAAVLKDDKDVTHWSSYVGEGAWRFILAFNVLPKGPNTGQFVIQTPSLAARDRVIAALSKRAIEDFPGSDIWVHRLAIGPPLGRPVQYRISGPDIATLRAKARDLAAIVATDPDLGRVTYDWNTPARVLRIHILQDKARQLGVSSQDVASVLDGVVAGTTATRIRDGIYLVNVVARAQMEERSDLSALRTLQINTGHGSFPLAAIARFDYVQEQPVIWRRDRMPTITLRANITTPHVQPDTVVARLAGKIGAFDAKLPVGYTIATGGAVEQSAQSQGPIKAVVPFMLLTIATLLMIQLQSFSRLFLVVSIAPLGLIGVSAALLISNSPLGFVAILGILALVGILIRNSVILVIQIETLVTQGKDRWTAVLEATQHRLRPILLTAAAASLALIPIAREVFWGPMAWAMMGGIVVGTALTLIFLPALYVLCYRVAPLKP